MALESAAQQRVARCSPPVFMDHFRSTGDLFIRQGEGMLDQRPVRDTVRMVSSPFPTADPARQPEASTCD
jgi:hypothetical protein